MTKEKKEPLEEIGEGVKELVAKTGELVGLYVRVSRDILKAAKHRAIEEGKKISEIVREALEKYARGEE